MPQFDALPIGLDAGLIMMLISKVLMTDSRSMLRGGKYHIAGGWARASFDKRLPVGGQRVGEAVGGQGGGWARQWVGGECSGWVGSAVISQSN